MISGPAGCMRRFRQMATTLLAVLAFSHATALEAASDDDEETITSEAMAFETHRIHRQNLQWFGKRKSRIGDYAEVIHKVGGEATHYFNGKLKFSLHVSTFEGAAVKLNVMSRTVYSPRDDDDKGLVEDFLDFAVEEKWGISNVEMSYDAYNSTYTTTIITGDSPDDTWQFLAERRWKAENGLVTSGALTNGSRTLQINNSRAPPTFEYIVDIHEDGNVLCRTIGGGKEYEFRTGLRPDVRLLLLTAMEILIINVHGEYG